MDGGRLRYDIFVHAHNKEEKKQTQKKTDTDTDGWIFCC